MVEGAEAVPAFPSAFRGGIILGSERLARFGRDESGQVGVPAAAARPSDTEDLAILIRWAREHRVPLVARGAGTSLDGESVPVRGGVVVDLSGWEKVGEVDPVERTVRVGAGVVNRDLYERLRPHGLFFPPNPGSWTSCTIGGNVATNASGPRSLRYGATRRWVRRIEGVLGNGQPAAFGASVSKRSMGPDLLGLMVGSEGTLGIFTEITLALAAAPGRRSGLVIPLPATPSVGTITQAFVHRPTLGLSALDDLDRRSATALSHEEGSRLPSGTALLLAEIESLDEAEETRHLEAWTEALRALGLHDAPIVYPDADRLWTLRGSSGTVLNRTLGLRVREDVAVPLGRLDELFEGIDRLAERFSVEVYVYGHLGDGNLHPNFVLDPTTERSRELRSALFELARRLAGTLSAEHGIGSVKREHVGLELGPAEIGLLRAVKSFCDPDGILNPGKLYPEGVGARARAP